MSAPEPTDYEVSSAYVDALVRALGSERMPAVLELMDPAAMQMVQNPWSDQWHPARYLESFSAAVVKLYGAQALEDLSHATMESRFGSIILPMLKKSLETTNRSPAAILSKVQGLVEIGIRGLDILWKPEDTGGILQIKYPRPVAEHVLYGWRGVLRYVFEVTQAGSAAEFFHSEDGLTLQFRLRW